MMGTLEEWLLFGIASTTGLQTMVALARQEPPESGLILSTS